MGDKKSARVIAKEIVIRLFVAVFLWAFLIVGFIYYPYSHPTMLPYLGLAFLVLWYFYIPLLWCVVTIAWWAVQRLAQFRRELRH
jgi:TRAP-type C4-dicarboxylate transport system permease small subunit